MIHPEGCQLKNLNFYVISFYVHENELKTGLFARTTKVSKAVVLHTSCVRDNDATGAMRFK